MAIIRFFDRPFLNNPWTDFEKIRKEMDKLAREMGGESNYPPKATVYPAMNISEDDEAIYVRAEIPGVDSDDVHISVEGETLTVEGERKVCNIVEKHSYHRREIDCGSFSRSITLPTRISVEKVSAKMKDGIIVIILPKAEEVKPNKITVKVG